MLKDGVQGYLDDQDIASFIKHDRPYILALGTICSLYLLCQANFLEICININILC